MSGVDAFGLGLRDNPLRTRADVERALLDLLEPLSRRYVDGGIKFGDSGVRYAPRVVLLEGWSRPLWGIAPLLAGGGSYPALERHREIFKRGVDPDDPAYWGESGDYDQRLVEMAAIALSLILKPDLFWQPLSDRDQVNAAAWLAAIQKRDMPENNWQFFRVLVCEALRSLGLPVDEDAEAASLDLIDSMYRGDGWYQDGVDVNFDYYNPLGFHFYGLVYAKVAGGRESERAARFRERARLFASQFLPWIREDGSVIPYGRSLAYRFAVISFFSACAFADEEVVPWPVMKGIVLRNLRSWFGRPIFDIDGALTIGHGYPNFVMAEQYNSPGSPYWSFKAFLVLALGEEHPFWRAEEAPLPRLAAVSVQPVPKYVISRSAEDVVLLCPGRYPGKEMVQAAAKFSKFAYSARFGFCVSHGSYGLEKTGCDSMLLLSEGDGYWRERRQAEDQSCGANWTSGRWRPWPDVTIETTLVALGAWHVRVHRIESARALETVEGGFSIPVFSGAGPERSPRIALRSAGRSAEAAAAEATEPENTAQDAAVAYPWAGSRIVDLSPPPASGYVAVTPTAEIRRGAEAAGRRGEILTLEPNLNVVFPLATLPVLRGRIGKGASVLACAVRAGDEEPTLAEMPPRLEFGIGGAVRVLAADGKVVAHIE